jgi:hypothetical protein
MAAASTVSKTARKATAEASLAKPLAPEEVRVGDFVAVLHRTYELPSFLWNAESFQVPINEPVRIQLIPDGGGEPLKVRAICLPFVFVKDPDGGQRTLDLRITRVARLHADFAKAVSKAKKKDRTKAGASLLL